MNKDYLRYTEAEITLFCGNNARGNVHTSLAQSRAISKAHRGHKIMYINTVFTTRKLLAAARLELAPPKTHHQWLGSQEGIIFQHIEIGCLSKHLAEIEAAIVKNGIKVLIINSWEFANRTYGFKERSLFGLLHIASELGVSVIIYSHHSPDGVVPGMQNRSGLGKLSVIASAIIWYDSDMILEEVEEKKRILSKRKINELEYARSKSGINEDGDLIVTEDDHIFAEEFEDELIES
ncbi:MAG: hypothetical protein ABI778_09735 [Ignavibacteriota bacterium]